MAKKNIAQTVRELIEPTVTAAGLSVWDVEFVREGADYYLRITIDADKEGGVDINDCEAVHRAIDPLLDEADPIECSYHLEVSSPGIERTLRLPEHFTYAKGMKIRVRLYTAQNGSREYCGVLQDYSDDTVTLSAENGEKVKLRRSDVAKANVLYNF